MRFFSLCPFLPVQIFCNAMCVNPSLWHFASFLKLILIKIQLYNFPLSFPCYIPFQVPSLQSLLCLFPPAPSKPHSLSFKLMATVSLTINILYILYIIYMYVFNTLRIMNTLWMYEHIKEQQFKKTPFQYLQSSYILQSLCIYLYIYNTHKCINITCWLLTSELFLQSHKASRSYNIITLYILLGRAHL